MNKSVPAPSFTLTSSIARDGATSSSVIVPVPWLSLMMAFVGLLRFRVNVSSGSSSTSPAISKVIVPESEPAGMLKVPEVDV